MAAAESILQALADYPVLDDMAYSDACWEAQCAYWEGMSIRERIEACARCEISIFAARRDYLPPDDSGMLTEHMECY